MPEYLGIARITVLFADIQPSGKTFVVLSTYLSLENVLNPNISLESFPPPKRPGSTLQPSC